MSVSPRWVGPSGSSSSWSARSPGSSVFVPVAEAAGRAEGLEDVVVRTSPLQRLYRGGGRYAHLLPLLPWAMAHADLSDADVVITSHHAFAQRVRPPTGVPVVSYVHTPARWIWEPGIARGRARRPGRCARAGVVRRHPAARRPAGRPGVPTRLVANSSTVADRIAHVVGPREHGGPPAGAHRRLHPRPAVERARTSSCSPAGWCPTSGRRWRSRPPAGPGCGWSSSGTVARGRGLRRGRRPRGRVPRPGRRRGAA